ncbi:hypothetical protein [Streptomyces sp. PanSC19]|uniref:hypothetical protein n=1 Tax=Streptomyces sp. PanSC19 TaxID=1520455 RepID=UPI0011CDC6FD|nr:hypothetical protein [Streptomyces sp. PanSC19]
MSARQRAWIVAGVVTAGLAAALGLLIAPLSGGSFLMTALVAVTPLLMQDHPKACARTCLVIGSALLAWAVIGAVIGMFLFAPAALLLVIAPFVDPGNRHGPWFSAIAPVVTAAAIALIASPPGQDHDPENEPPPSFRATLDSTDRFRDRQFNERKERLLDHGATRVEVYEYAGRLILQVGMPDTFTDGRTEGALRDEIAGLPGVVDIRRCTFHTCDG